MITSSRKSKANIEEATNIMLTPVDSEKLAAAVGASMKEENDKFKDYEFELAEKWGLIEVGNGFILTDDEACFLASTPSNAPYKIAIRRKATKEIKEDGTESEHIYPFAVWNFEITPDQLKGFLLPEQVSLFDFMDDRFNYNKRLEGNIEFLLETITIANKTKK